MKTIKHYNPELGKNWNVVRGGGIWIADGRTAIVKCPKCGLAQNLGTYTIARDGEVTPYFACYGPGCAFVEKIKLEGWTPTDVDAEA